MIVVSRHLGPLLASQLERSRQEEVTYPEIGETRSSILPVGYTHDRWVLPVGVGDAAWEGAKQAISSWKAHAQAKFTITPRDAPLQEGSTVLVSRTFGPVTAIAPCRLIYVTDQPGSFGFAYGTLPGHPEQGEEAFRVLRDRDGTVTVQIMAFSRPNQLLPRLAGPVAREVQNAAARRYLAGIERHVAIRK